MNLTETVPLSSLSDEETIARVLNGEKYLYEKIMRKYNQRLYRISMSIINDSEEAEDILQESYIKAYEHLNDFQNNASFSTWLTRIVINESLQRKLKRNRIQAQKEKLLKESNSYSTQSPLDKIMNTELKNILEKALAGLPEKYRLVFIMREVENMSISETMDCLKISEPNVKVRLNRAKEMLRNSLSSHYKTSELYDFHLTKCDRVVKNVLDYIATH
jgi:RNA polymerase sigma factor (sigma-70 family)